VKWLAKPEAHDYDAAVDYLSLLVSKKVAQAAAWDLERVGMTERKAKDILRASRLPLLAADNKDVARQLGKASLSPILLVRTPLGLEVADGYHRLCAAYHLDEDAEIPCKLVSLK
jgi:hypothetical protein